MLFSVKQGFYVFQHQVKEPTETKIKRTISEVKNRSGINKREKRRDFYRQLLKERFKVEDGQVNTISYVTSLSEDGINSFFFTISAIV